MRAVICRTLDGPEKLEIGEVEDAVVTPGRVLIEVRAVAVTFPDLLMTRGLYQMKPELPFVPGAEVAGVVREVGEGVTPQPGDGVTPLRPGERVLAMAPAVSGMTELINVRPEVVVPLPDAIDFPDAAGLLYAYGTSHHALKDRAKLQPGESLLVLGAAGSVGLAAVELGKAMGARVIAAASTPEKLQVCVEHGADETVNYATEDLKTRVRELTGGEGADVVYDPVGGPYSEPALRSTAWEGRFLVIGFANGEIPRLPLNLPLLRGCSIVGVFWGAFAGRAPERHKANTAELLDWVVKGRVKPYTSAIFPLERAREAFALLDGRQAVGKVVLTLDDQSPE